MQSANSDFAQIVVRYENSLKQSNADIIRETIAACSAFFDRWKLRSFCDEGHSSGTASHWYTRFATALTTFVSHPKGLVTQELLDFLPYKKQELAYLFAASGFGDMSHLVNAAVSIDEQGQAALSTDKALLLIVMLPLDSITDHMMDIALQQSPQILTPIFLGWLSERAVLTEQGEKNRTKLVASGHLIEGVTPNQKILATASVAYMQCSYALSPTRHDVKLSINRLFRKAADQAGIKLQVVHHKIVAKPRLIVIPEVFYETHAMFRCLAPYIRALREHFEVFILAAEEVTDRACDTVCDRTVRFSLKESNVNDLVHKIQGLNPQVIYYPSLGMSDWSVQLSNLRLAPIQLAMLGHPATTRSPEIDFVYINEVHESMVKKFSEKVLMGYGKVPFDVPESLAVTPELIKNRTMGADVCKVAVNSKVMKLNTSFLTACKRIQEASVRPVEFHFMPNEKGLAFDGLRVMLKHQFPGCVVWPSSSYTEYLSNLASCEISLAAFPFGNTNGTVDSCLIGMPTVALDSHEPSQGDRFVLESAGFPTDYLVSNEDDYIKVAADLINHPESYRDLPIEHPMAEVRARILNRGDENAGESFAHLVWYVYQNLELITSSKDQLIRHDVK